MNLLVKKDLIPLFLFFILVGCSEQAKENQLNAEAEIDTNRVAIGDVFHYTVTASAPDDRLLGFPELEGSTALEVRSSDHSVDDYGMHKVEFKLALWDTGYHSVPAYPIEVFLRDSTLEQVHRRFKTSKKSRTSRDTTSSENDWTCCANADIAWIDNFYLVSQNP